MYNQHKFRVLQIKYRRKNNKKEINTTDCDISQLPEPEKSITYSQIVNSVPSRIEFCWAVKFI